MSGDYEEDPEVTSDLLLREQSMRDPSRSREVPEYVPPVLVEEWPCRTCGDPVGVPLDAVERVDIFNRALAARREPLLDKTRIMFCAPCIDKHSRLAVLRRRDEVDKLEPVIAKLKASRNPAGERELIAQLEKLHHPDVEGLVESLTRERKKPMRSPA